VNDFVKGQRLIISSCRDMNRNASSQPENTVHLPSIQFTNYFYVFQALNTIFYSKVFLDPK
jgi:hypothetical protein